MEIKWKWIFLSVRSGSARRAITMYGGCIPWRSGDFDPYYSVQSSHGGRSSTSYFSSGKLREIARNNAIDVGALNPSAGATSLSRPS